MSGSEPDPPESPTHTEEGDVVANTVQLDSPYRRLLHLPNVALVLVLGMATRIPIAMESIALVLFAREETRSFAIAGAVAAVFVLALGLSTPILARMADRFGAARVMQPLAFLHAAALGALVLAGSAGLPGTVLIALGFVAGGSYPPATSVVRLLLSRLTLSNRELVPTAFALDSIAAESVFVGGPLLTAVLVGLASPAAALIFAAAVCVIGVTALNLTPIVRTLGPRDATPERDWLGALRSRGLSIVVVYSLPVGMVFGAVPVTAVAFGESKGSPGSGAWLIALMSVGGALGAYVYGARAERLPARNAAVIVACVAAVMLVPLLLASSLVAIGLLLVVAGAVITPLVSVSNHIVSEVAVPGTEAEAFTWPFTATLVGSASGAGLAGQLIEGSNWRAGMVLTVACGFAIAAIIVACRRSLPDTVSAPTT